MTFLRYQVVTSSFHWSVNFGTKRRQIDIHRLDMFLHSCVPVPSFVCGTFCEPLQLVLSHFLQIILTRNTVFSYRRYYRGVSWTTLCTVIVLHIASLATDFMNRFGGRVSGCTRICKQRIRLKNLPRGKECVATEKTLSAVKTSCHLNRGHNSLIST